MARIRTIKPEFFTSADIVTMTPLSRLFYASLWCEADRDGRLKWDVRTLKIRYFPADNCDINAMAEELINAGLVMLYEVNGKQYAVIPSFLSHQAINNREAESVIPPPPIDAPFTRESGVQGEGKEGKEGNGKEGKGIRVTAPEITFPEFIKSCEEKSVLPIPEDDPVFNWAATVRIPTEFIFVGWQVFKLRDWVDAKGKPKKYKDWPAVFLNYCKNPDWLDVWSINRDGEYYLTAKGKQAQREFCGVTA
ncbi:MAG: hypothetical protein PHP57_13910 [Sideroxydans sp.]|nr:hypothetical protein [Sideroxydans sp.]